MRYMYVTLAVALGAASASAATLNADSVVWSGGVLADGVVASASRNDPDNALGAADGAFLSLGLGGWAVFGFGENFASPAGVVEITYGCPSGSVGFCGSYAEEVEVLTSNSFTGNLTGFVSQGTIKNGQAQGGGTVTLAPGAYKWLALRDISPVSAGRDGFDIDSVSVEQVDGNSVVAAVPTPASVLMLGAGLLGLGLIRQRRG